MIGNKYKTTVQEMPAEFEKNNRPSSEHRTARLEQASRFLIVMLDRLQQGNLTTPDEVVELYKNFRQEHAGLGDDFELGHTLQIAWQRDLVNKCIAKDAPEKVPEDAIYIEAALHLLEDAENEEIP